MDNDKAVAETMGEHAQGSRVPRWEPPTDAAGEESPVHTMLRQRISDAAGIGSQELAPQDGSTQTAWGQRFFLRTDGDEPSLWGVEREPIHGTTAILAAIKAGKLRPPEPAAPEPVFPEAVDVEVLRDLVQKVDQIVADMPTAAADAARMTNGLQNRINMIEQTVKSMLQQRDAAAQQLELNLRASALNMALTALGAPHTPIDKSEPVQAMYEAFCAMLRA